MVFEEGMADKKTFGNFLFFFLRRFVTMIQEHMQKDYVDWQCSSGRSNFAFYYEIVEMISESLRKNYLKTF